MLPSVVLFLALSIESFAAEITEENINEFAKGMQELQNLQYSPPPEKPFDPLKYDEHAAFQSAEEYDFVIIGSGASGAVIANRLSEVPEWKILLLEAGGIETPYTQVPGLAGAVLGSSYDWGYLTEPQDTWCLGMVDRRCTTQTGKGLGGGTTINGMIFTRGNPRDYDLWADQGNDGWCYKDVLPYFKKAEDCALKEFDRRYHHQGGPLHVEETQGVVPLFQTFISAGEELGYKVLDYNGKEQIGFSKAQASTKHGKRHSAAQSYLLPYANRRNLHIKQLSHVIQIMVNAHTKEAVGVKYMRNETMYIAKAHKEVILSAGPFNSPQLLMLSGIGPQEDLANLHIPLIKNLPVGKHLKDHVAFPGLNFILNISKFPVDSAHDQIATWLKYGKGPLAAIAGTVLAFIKTDASKDPTHYPDVELILGRTGFSDRLRIRDEYRPVLDPRSTFETFKVDIMPLHPKSTGTIRLNSKNPYSMPRINNRQFSDPEEHDLETVLGAIKKVMQLVNTKAFQKIGARLSPEPIQDCKQFGFGSDNYWKCAARYLSIPVRHQTGTCRMGPRSDKFAVVDNKLRVYGVHKLRVADSSVIPVTVSGHTHAASNMVGEKAADIIKEYWI